MSDKLSESPQSALPLADIFVYCYENETAFKILWLDLTEVLKHHQVGLQVKKNKNDLYFSYIWQYIVPFLFLRFGWYINNWHSVLGQLPDTKIYPHTSSYTKPEKVTKKIVQPRLFLNI